MLREIRSALASWIAPPTIGTSLGYGWLRPASLTGMRVDEQSALGIAAVSQAVRLYADTIAALQCFVARKNPRGGWQEATDLWAYDLVRHQPNPQMTSFGFWQTLIVHSLTRGNGYAEIEWDRTGRQAVALHLMDPRTTKPVIQDGQLRYVINARGESLGADEVLHIHGFGWDGISGYSPITLATETLGIAQAQTAWEASLYGNSATAAGHLEFAGDLTAEQRRQIRQGWNETHQGVGNNGKVGVLQGGAKWVSTSFSPADAELILSRGFSVAEVARLFNLPGWALGVPGIPRPASQEEANNNLYTLSLLPFLTMVEQELNSKLLSKSERSSLFFHFNVRTLLRGDSKSLVEENAKLFAMGARTINEIRLSMGDNPIDEPWADKNWMPTNNMAAIQDLKPGEPTQPAVNKPAAPAPEPATRKARDAMRSVLADPIVRMTRVEAKALCRLASRDRFDDEAASFYSGHIPKLAEALAPAVKAANDLLGTSLDAGAIAQNLADDALGELRSLWTLHAPQEIPAHISALTARWESDRATTLVAHLLEDGSRG